MKIIKYSLLFGALIAVFIYFSGFVGMNDKQRLSAEEKILGSVEISNVIGNYQRMDVKKTTKYQGSPSNSPYTAHIINVTGDKGSILIKLTITNPDTVDESIAIDIQ